MMQGNHGHNYQRQEATYVDFMDTRPPIFTKADEPLEADDWLRTMEQKFDLIPCTEFQKPVFAAQQLRGAAGAWCSRHSVNLGRVPHCFPCPLYSRGSYGHEA